MTDEVSNKFCWRGVLYNEKVVKYPVKEMALVNVFQGIEFFVKNKAYIICDIF